MKVINEFFLLFLVVVAGRLLFTGALVAALLMLFVCLLLCCVIFTTRRVRTATRVLTEEKIELNHISEHNGEVTTTSGQNGGNNIPLLISNHHPSLHSNSTSSPNFTNHNRPTTNGPLPNNVISRKSPGVSVERGRERSYKALPTADPDDDEGDGTFGESRMAGDGEEWDLSETEVIGRPRNSRPPPPHHGQGTVRKPAPRPPPPNPPLQLRTQGLENSGAGSGSSNFFISNAKKGASSSSSSVSDGGLGSRPKYLPPRPPQPRDIKFPDLIDQKMSSDYSSLPRPNRNHDP